MELNERIILLRKQAGLTQEQLGEKLGVSRQAVSKWESGQANPDVTYITEMCRLFDVSANWLLLDLESNNDTDRALCPACSAPIGSHDRFCPQCGVTLAPEKLMGRCPDCGAVLSSDVAFCTKCGKQLDGNETYCLYLTKTPEYSATAISQRLYRMMNEPWVSPAFPCDESFGEGTARFLVLNAAPLTLCCGLTYEQALKCAKHFEDYPGVVKVYRDSDMVTEPSGEVRPNAPSLAIAAPATSTDTPESREPLGAGMIFLLVVLGVIAAILLMSFF